MKNTLTILLTYATFSCSIFSYAQTFKVNLSPKHLAKVNSITSGEKQLKKYKKLFSRDSNRQTKKQNKLLHRKLDSINKVSDAKMKLRLLAEKKGINLPMDTLAMLQQYQALLPKDSASTAALKKKGTATAEKIATSQLSPDQLQEVAKLKGLYGTESTEVKKYLGAFQKKDSAATKELKLKALATAKEQTMKALPTEQRKQLEMIQKEYGPYSKEVSGYLSFLKDSVDVMDTLSTLAGARAEQAAQGLLEKNLANGQIGKVKEMQSQLEDIKGKPTEYQNKLKEYNDPEKAKNAAKEKAQQAALEKFAQSSQVKSMTDKLNKLKGKYSSILNSNDMSTAIKEKSLQGRPLRERWVIGGNFGVASTAPLMIDLSPQFGYRINKKFQAGISIIYRVKFVDSVKVSNAISQDHYGYGAFASHGLILNFFAYAEFERTASLVKAAITGDKARHQWSNNLFLGVGRKFVVHPKLNGTVLLLWNPLHINGVTPFHEAFVIKTGFQLSELGLLKK